MLLKANSAEHICPEVPSEYSIGGKGQIYPIYRLDANTLRMFVPLLVDKVANFETDNANKKLMEGFLACRWDKNGTFAADTSDKGTSLGITQVVPVAGGVAVDCYAPGDIMGGLYVISNILKIGGGYCLVLLKNLLSCLLTLQEVSADDSTQSERPDSRYSALDRWRNRLSFCLDRGNCGSSNWNRSKAGSSVQSEEQKIRESFICRKQHSGTRVQWTTASENKIYEVAIRSEALYA